jgi:hypothetical protein
MVLRPTKPNHLNIMYSVHNIRELHIILEYTTYSLTCILHNNISCTFAEVASQLLLPEPVPCAPDVVPNQHLNNVNIVDGIENQSL